MTDRCWSLTATVVVAAAVACGDSSQAPPSAGPVPVTLDTLCEALAEADCSRLEACDALRPPVDSAAECERRQREVWCAPVQEALQLAANLDEVRFIDAEGERCRDAVAARACTVGLDGDILALDACRGMVEGERGPGQSCPVSAACAAGSFCAITGTCPGTCERYAQLNEPCGLSALCDPSLYCSLIGMRCRMPADADATCEQALVGNACRPGSFCDTAQPGQPRCAPVRGRGQGCTQSVECLAGARCISNRCSAGLEGDVCSDGGDCGASFVCAAGRCVPPVGTDGPCGPSQPCDVGLACTSTVGSMLCRPQPTEGEDCSLDRPCYRGRCLDGACVASAEDGEACSQPEDCLPGRTCDGTCSVQAACF